MSNFERELRRSIEEAYDAGYSAGLDSAGRFILDLLNNLKKYAPPLIQVEVVITGVNEIIRVMKDAQRAAIAEVNDSKDNVVSIHPAAKAD